MPDVGSLSRPKSRRPRLTIDIREGGRLKPAESSRAFPGWTAEEIHRALNEGAMSAGTAAALHRVGGALTAAEGGGPDDDPWLRPYREKSRAEGRADGRAETRYESVVAIFEARGIAASPALSARLAELGAMPVAAMVRAALRCASESQFVELCAAERRQTRGDGE